MAVKQKEIYVYDDFSFDSSMLLGKLYVSVVKGGENYSFEYNTEWLKKTNLCVSLDPELMPFAGRQYPFGKNIFGMFADASPDRWGRVLMNKRERILAEREGRKPSKLYDSDYLMGVYDETGWEASGLKKIQMDLFYQMIKKQQLRRGQPFGLWKKLQETLKMTRRDYQKSG